MEITDLTRTDLNSILKSNTQISELRNSQKIDLTNRLTKLVLLRGEVPERDYPCLSEWIGEFESRGYTYEEICRIIENAKSLERYNPLAFGDVISAWEKKGNAPDLTYYKSGIIKLNEKIEEQSKRILELESQISHNEYCADVERFLKDNQFMAEKCKQQVKGGLLMFVKRVKMEFKDRTHFNFEFWLNQRQTEYERELEKINEYFKN